MQYKNDETSNSAILNNVTWKLYDIKEYNIKIVKYNTVQHLQSSALDSAQ